MHQMISIVVCFIFIIIVTVTVFIYRSVENRAGEHSVYTESERHNKFEALLIIT